MTVIATREQVPHIIRAPAPAGAHRPAQASGPGLTGTDILRIFRKRKWLILICFVSCLAADVTITALWLSYYPQYTADAYLGVKLRGRAGDVTEAYVTGDAIDRKKTSLAQMAKSEEVFNQALLAPKVRATEWFQQDPGRAVIRMGAIANATTVRETQYVRLSVTGPKPGELTEIVRAWADAVVAEETRIGGAEMDREIQSITSQQNQIKDELQGIEGQFRQSGNSDSDAILHKLGALNSSLEELKKKIVEIVGPASDAEQKLESLKRMNAQGQIDNHPEVMNFMDNDPTLRGLRQGLMDQEISRDILIAKFGENSRAVNDTRGRIESLQTQLAEREKTSRRLAVAVLMSRFQSDYEKLSADKTAMETRETELKSEIGILNADLKKINDLKMRKNSLDNDFHEWGRILQDYQKIRQDEGRATYVRRYATPPQEPSLPRWSVNIPVGGLLGVVIGMGLALLLELMDTSIKSPSDVSRRVDLPMLGMVPHASDLEEEIEDLRLAFLTNPNSLFGEAFRQIRTTLQFAAPSSQLRSILVTSTLPGEGRSTVSLNLSAATAHGGKRVLVVEANFHQPMMHALFPQTPSGGLSNVLVGQSNWRDLVREVHPNLYVLASGPLPPNPSELLGSDTMRSLVSELAGEYDQVIYDGAPCLLVTDPTVLSTLMDGVVLVVRAGTSTYGVVQRVRDVLGRVGARIFGVVLNGIRVTAGGYLRKNYRTFYEYHAPAEAAEAARAGQRQQLPK